MPEFLHYYCANSTFLSLMEKSSIWLTALDHSNDRLEGAWARKQYKEIAERGSRGKSLKVETALSPYFSTSYAFGMCFSQREDLLSQWRGYADDGAGIAITFRTEALQRIVSKNNYSILGLKLAEIKYGRLEDHGFVKKIWDVFGSDIDAVNLDGTGRATANIEVTAEKWETAAQFYEYKNAAFSEEEEWRLYCVHRLSNDLDFKFRNRGSSIVPHLELAFDADCVEYVTLGPKNGTPVNVAKAVMRQNGFDPRVLKSSASYR